MTQTGTPSTAQQRRDLIRTIEAARGSKVITYFVSDRPGATAQIAEDAVRPMYDHLQAIGPSKKIDLFLYSTGGLTDAPWRIVTMIREFAEEFAVLVPYKAMSAATMIALGADEVVMGRKGELGPIDPQLSITRGGEGETAVQEQVGVEDVMSYIRFVKTAGVEDQAPLATIITGLADKVDPRILGQINRAHSHIRDVARKLLTSRFNRQELNEGQITLIINTLAEQTYQHGHAIGRKEAAQIGLNVVHPAQPVEDAVWQLFVAYEDLCKLRTPIEPRAFIPAGMDEHQEMLTMACIESEARSDHFTSNLRMRNKRQAPPQLVFNLNLNLNLPQNLQPQQLPQGMQQAVQETLQQLQQDVQGIVQRELMQQMPSSGMEGWTEHSAWRQQSDWPIGANG